MKFKCRYLSLSLRLLLVVFAISFLLRGKRPEEVNAQLGTICQQVLNDVTTPLTDYAVGTTYKGEPTRLYPDYSNTPPPSHLNEALVLANQIEPLNAAGQPDPNGAIVIMSIGMSNTEIEFINFSNLITQAQQAGQVNPRLVPINGAQGGMDASLWADPNSAAWQVARDKLAQSGLTPEQVQVIWMKHAHRLGYTSSTPDFISKAQRLLSDIRRSVQNLTTPDTLAYYPNLKLVYLASRTRAHTDDPTDKSPEPVAFETAYAVKWLIEEQINGTLVYGNGNNNSYLIPRLLWGPYLWIDGYNARLDGRIWPETMLQADCVHPSDAGRDEVADMLMDFFSVDQTATSWFLASLASPTPGSTSGDANGDGKVDGIDYVIWLNHYNTTTSNGAGDGDFNGDGVVDGVDYVLWISNYGI